MRLSGIKFGMAMIALLAFISQAFAVVDIPCAGMDNHPAPTVTTDQMAMDSTMAHASHVQSDDSDASGGADCCNHKQCSQADCLASNVAVVSSLALLSVQFPQRLNTEYLFSFLTQDASSLFRPPISR